MRPIAPAATAAIRNLHRQGFRLLIGSNTEVTCKWELMRAEVHHLFTELTESWNLGSCKPDREFYAAVVEAAKCPANQVLFVGNNIHHDVIGPMESGMRAVFINPGGSAVLGLPEKVPVIRNIGALPRFLE